MVQWQSDRRRRRVYSLGFGGPWGSAGVEDNKVMLFTPMCHSDPCAGGDDDRTMGALVTTHGPIPTSP